MWNSTDARRIHPVRVDARVDAGGCAHVELGIGGARGMGGPRDGAVVCRCGVADAQTERDVVGEPRRPAQKQVSGAAERPVGFESVLCHPSGDPPERRLEDVGAYRSRRQQPLRMWLFPAQGALEFDLPDVEIEPDDGAPPTIGTGVLDLSADPHPALLRRQLIAPHARALLGPDPGGRVEAADRRRILDQLVEAERAGPEELPPLGAVLPAMPFQEVGEEGTTPLRVCPGLGVLGEAVQQAGLDRLQLGVALGQVLCRSGCRVAGPHGRADGADQIGPALLQPVSQPSGADAVVAVVVLDGVEDRLVTLGEPPLVLDDTGSGVLH